MDLASWTILYPLCTFLQCTYSIIVWTQDKCFLAQFYWRLCSFYPCQAKLAMAPCLSVCLSVCLCVSVCVCSSHGVLSKRLNEPGWFLARELLSSYPTLCCKEIRVTLKIRVLPSGTLFKTLDFLENFAMRQRVRYIDSRFSRSSWVM